MHEYFLSSEWVRFAFVMGIAVSMVIYEKRHLTTGSIVVPGYIAVFILHPLVIVATFANALLTYWLVNGVLRRYVLVYGRTKFTILAVVSTLIQMVLTRVTPTGSWLWESDVPMFVGVGYIVPALIAHDMARQGVGKTVTSVIGAGAIVAIPIAVAILLKVPGVNDLAPVDGYGQIAIEAGWIPVAMAFAIAGSWGVAHNYGLRSGGFVGAAFAAMLMGNPVQVAIAVAIAGLTWLIVTRLVMRHMILFGRRKFSMMLVVASMLSWWSLWIGDNMFGTSWEQNFGVGSLALMPLMLPGLLANDAQRTSPKKVLAGFGLVVTFTLSATWWVQATFEPVTLDLAWKALAVASASVVFWPQLSAMANRVRSLLRPGRGTWIAVLDHLSAAVRPAGTAAPATTFGAVGLPPSSASMSGRWSPDQTPWDIWRQQHPDAAAAAERWVEQQLGSRRPSPPAVPARRYLDQAAASILDRQRGAIGWAAHERDRTAMAPVYAPGHRTDTFSGVSGAHREAHLAASDTPDPLNIQVGISR